MLTLTKLVNHNDDFLPPLNSGQVHAFSATTHEPLVKIVAVLQQQASVIYLCAAEVSERERLFSPSEHVAQAEVKLRKLFNSADFYSGLDALTAGHKVVVMHLSTEPSALNDFLLNGAQLVTLEKWAASEDKILCLCFSGDLTSTSLEQQLTQLESRFQSFSSFSLAPNGFWLEVNYWFHRGKVRQDKFRIVAGSEHEWTLDSTNPMDEDHAKLRLEQAPIFYLSSAVTGQEIAPVEWQQLRSEQAVATALERNSDDAILLSYYRGQDIVTLMKTIFQLRSYFGRYLRIYVRELDQSIRHTDEQLLLQAGATLILPINLRFSQVVSLIESSVGWRFSRFLPHSFAALQEQFVPKELQGYTPLSSFVQHVRRLARLASEQNIDYSLVLGKPARGLKVVDIVQRFHHRRGGDLVSSAERLVPIFLFGCRAQDVTHTLEFLFGAPLANVFANDQRIHTLQSLEGKLDDLEAGHNNLDLTSALVQAEHTEEHVGEDLYRRVFPQGFSPLHEITPPSESES